MSGNVIERYRSAKSDALKQSDMDRVRQLERQAYERIEQVRISFLERCGNIPVLLLSQKYHFLIHSTYGAGEAEGIRAKLRQRGLDDMQIDALIAEAESALERTIAELVPLDA